MDRERRLAVAQPEFDAEAARNPSSTAWNERADSAGAWNEIVAPSVEAYSDVGKRADGGIMRLPSRIFVSRTLVGLTLAWGVTVGVAAEPGPPEAGGEQRVTNHEDGGRTVEVRGRRVEPHSLSTRYDAEGRVVETESVFSDGTVDRSSYDPLTGERRATRIAPDGATTRSRSEADGSSVIVQTGFGVGTVTTRSDASGNTTETTDRPDGTRRVVSHSGAGPTTTTEFDANGKPTRSETRTDGDLRIQTGFDVRGNPVKTEVREDRSSGSLLEETTYWPGTSVPRVTRRWTRGEVDQVFYYDREGRETRRNQAPGSYGVTGTRWVFDPDGGPTQRSEPIPAAEAADTGDTPGGADTAEEVADPRRRDAGPRATTPSARPPVHH